MCPVGASLRKGFVRPREAQPSLFRPRVVPGHIRSSANLYTLLLWYQEEAVRVSLFPLEFKGAVSQEVGRRLWCLQRGHLLLEAGFLGGFLPGSCLVSFEMTHGQENRFILRAASPCSSWSHCCTALRPTHPEPTPMNISPLREVSRHPYNGSRPTFGAPGRGSTSFHCISSRVAFRLSTA